MNTTKAPSKYTEVEYVRPPHGACPGCAMPLSMRYVFRALGEKVIMVITPGCGSIIANYPRRIFRYNDEIIPVMASPLGSAAITAGVSLG